MNLDKYLIKTTKISFDIKGKNIEADVSSLALLKVADITNKNLSETDSTIAIFKVIFGDVNTKFIFKSLNLKGIEILTTEIIKHLNPIDEDGEKTPSK